MPASYAFTNYAENKVLTEMLGIGSAILPSGVYVCLFGASPGDAGAFASELATGIASQYTRIRGFFSATGPTNDGFAENATDILFPTSGTAWPTVTHMGIADVATQGGGNLLWWGPLTTVQTVLVNQRFKFAQGDLDVTVD